MKQGLIMTSLLKESTKKLIIDGKSLTTEAVFWATKNREIQLVIPQEAQEKVKASSDLLQKFINEKRVIYGVNTSLGGFVNYLIPPTHAKELQENLIAAVSTNVGPYLDDQVVRASMLARIHSLARGTSAISLENFNKLIEIYNKGIIPCVPAKGSLGASGDLGPLACIALVGVGKWRAKYKNKIFDGREALKQAKIEPMTLSFKEGLSLINGTSTMAGYSSLLIEESIALVKTYDLISCLTFEGLKTKKKPFNPITHREKSHRGQLVTARNIWMLLEDSQMIVDEQKIEKLLQSYMSSDPKAAEFAIEDAYSIRCTPHILGPIRDNLLTIQSTVNCEINSSSDNPLILPDSENVFHNGHFHGQYIAMAMDHLSISLTTLSNLSDRRIDRFMDKNHSNHLPPFLCAEKPGLRLGLMGGQFMATSLNAENRSLCTPLSVQTLTSTGDFQDIVSLGLIASRRAHEIFTNTCYVLAFELLCAVQAAEIRGVDQLSRSTRLVFDLVREIVPYFSKDEPLTDYLENLSHLIRSQKILLEVEKIHGKIEI